MKEEEEEKEGRNYRDNSVGGGGLKKDWEGRRGEKWRARYYKRGESGGKEERKVETDVDGLERA